MKRSGFTLLELAALMVVAGILCALTVPKFAHCINNLKAAELPRSIKAIQRAEESYYREMAQYADCPWADANGDNSNDNIENNLGIQVAGNYFYYAADASEGNFSIESWVYRSFGKIAANTKVVMDDRGVFTYSGDDENIERLKKMCHYLR